MKFDYNSVFIAAPFMKPKTGRKPYDREINGVEFTRDVQNTILKMSEQGYELFQTIPLISSEYYSKTYTEGVTLVFRKSYEQDGV